jgi:hypothetical protein
VIIDKKWGVAVGGIVVVLAVFCALSFFNAGNVARDYEKSFASWNTDKKAKLLTMTSTLPEKMYVFEFNQVAENSGLEIQRKSCDTVNSTLQGVSTVGETMPRLGMVFLGTLNNEYAAAQKRASERAKAVTEYVEKAKTAFGKIVADCKWNYGYNTGAVPSHEAYKKVEETYMQPGESLNGKTCVGDKPCLPVLPEKRAIYVQAYRKYVALSSTNDAKWYGGEDCKNTSFGKDGCKKVADVDKAYDVATSAYLESFASQPAGSSEIDAKYSGITAAQVTYRKTMIDIYKMNFPNQPVPEVMDSASAGSDTYLDAAAKALIANLVVSQQKLKDLR